MYTVAYTAGYTAKFRCIALYTDTHCVTTLHSYTVLYSYTLYSCAAHIHYTTSTTPLCKILMTKYREPCRLDSRRADCVRTPQGRDSVPQAEFFHRLWDNPGGAVKKEKLLVLELSPDYRHECGICDRDYMFRRGCQCCRD